MLNVIHKASEQASIWYRSARIVKDEAGEQGQTDKRTKHERCQNQEGRKNYMVSETKHKSK